ncbi:MAG: CPP1-like family protein [Thermosynechococcaceae cyanobacterium]
MEDKRMSEQNPYTKLEVPENASFEEIQGARDRMIERHPNDERCRQDIEAAYDAILMDRLRKRQEGKITVPEGVRFAEQANEVPAKLSFPKTAPSPVWLKRLLDQPSPKEVLMAGGVFTALGIFAVLNQTADALALLLALGVGFTLYWINRKEQRLGRAFVITLAALAIGGLLSSLILQVGLPAIGLRPEAIITLVILVLFWSVSSFLR